MSVAMKCFERLVMFHINTIILETLDPLQCAYRPNRSTDDAISIALHTALSHLDNRNTSVRMLFIDYRHDSNSIIKFADDTTVVGLITDNNETAYREVVRDLAMWCQGNNLFLNVIKTKEMIVDYYGAVVEQVESFKFLGVHITNKQTWSKHTKTAVKRAQENLFDRPQILKGSTAAPSRAS